jgi:predicted metalloprotease
VIAHEVGHHVENLLGILPKVQQAQRRASDRGEANNLSVRVELMADCLAGVWANKMNQRRSNIDENDVRQAVAAATAIGDDRLQRQSQGYAVPDSFTHGSSEQRVRWLMTGLKNGDVRTCNTFQTQRL